MHGKLSLLCIVVRLYFQDLGCGCGCVSATRCANPPLHCPCCCPPYHSTTCQRNHGSLRTEGAGLGHGEPTEALWSVLGEHGHTTQYMHPHRRRGRLERATLHVAEGVAARHPETLEGMAQRALQKRSDAIANIRATVDSLQLDGALEEAAMDQQVAGGHWERHISLATSCVDVMMCAQPCGAWYKLLTDRSILGTFFHPCISCRLVVR